MPADPLPVAPVFSHGEGAPDVWAPHNINVFLPESGHPSRGIVRTVLKDANDNSSAWFYTDTDGLVNVNSPRDLHGHPNLIDGRWHHYTLAVTGPRGSKGDPKGFRIYLDGKLAARVAGGKGGDPVDPRGLIRLCGRGDEDPSRHYGGQLAQLSFFDTYLSTKEVFAMWNSEFSALFEHPSAAKSAAEQAQGGTPAALPATCEEQMLQTDCNGACFADVYNKGWLGDGVCDSGAFGRVASGGGIDLSCHSWEWDAGDCDTEADPVALQRVPPPKAYFKFDEGAGTELHSVDGGLTGHSRGAEWVWDKAFASHVLKCTRQEHDVITLPDVGYGAKDNAGGFTLNFWVSQSRFAGLPL